MRKLGKGLVTLVCIVGLVIMFGCATFQELGTLCHIDGVAIKYAGLEATSYLPWTTLWDAQRIRKGILYNHKLTQMIYQRAQEDDNIEVAYIIESLDTSIMSAEEFKNAVFDPAGPIGLALPMIFGGTLGALFIPRKRERDLEKQLNGKTNRTV